MNNDNPYVLTINAGSSSIRFGVYETNDFSQRLSGKIDRIGLNASELIINKTNGNGNTKQNINAPDFHTASVSLINWLEKQDCFPQIKMIGHRVVHGMKHTKAEVITSDLLEELNSITSYDPDHLPAELEIIQIVQQKHSRLLQVACFDTAFHTTIPEVGK